MQRHSVAVLFTYFFVDGKLYQTRTIIGFPKARDDILR